MITSVSNITQDVKQKYLQLFTDLTILLLGYESVRVYDATSSKNTTYYYRKDESLDARDYTFEEIVIENVGDFERELALHSLYIKAKGPEGSEYADGWDGVKLGFIGEGEELTNFQGITSLEEYLSWLYTIKTINEDYVYHYMRLPIDEEVFEIDANARTINIPTAFRKNGIAVQGDDVAEDIYFSIDRYFDIVDFNNCDIFIQWTTPKTKTKIVAPVKYRDITSDPGKLIFGCPITSEITKEAGNATFSIRFVQYDDAQEKIVYSFNTLTNTVKINTSIGIDLTDTASYTLDEVGSRLVDRIKFVEVVGGAKAAEPEFVLDVNDDQEDLIFDIPDGKDSYELKAQAISSDTGAITYIWYKKEIDNENNEITDSAGNPISGDSVSSTFGYVPIDESELKTGYVYYYKESADDDNYVRYVHNGTVSDKLFYEQVSICNADQVGSYYVTARNRITNSIAVKTSTNHAKFPKPTKPVITVLEKENGGFFNDEGTVELSVTASKADTENEKQSYQWMYKASKDDEFEAIDEATGNSYVASKEDKGSGYYTVVVTNTRNKVSFDSDITHIVRATGVPTAPNYSMPGTKSIYENEVNEDFYFYVELDEEQPEHDELFISWYVHQENYEDKAIVENVHAEVGSESLKFYPLAHEKAIGEATDGNIAARYYVCITNTLNDASFITNVPDEDKMFEIYPAKVVEPEKEEEESEPTIQSVTLDNPINTDDDELLF